MANSLVVNVLGSQEPFCDLLRESKIEFTEHSPASGVVMASGTVVEILYGVAAIAGSLGSVAAVLVAWIRSKSSRKVIVTTNKNEVVHLIQGMSAEDVERVLHASKNLIVFDSEPNNLK